MATTFGKLTVGDAFIIHCRHRKDRKKKMTKQMRKKKVPQNSIKWYPVKLNEDNPAKGRFLSHMSIIRQAKKRYLKNVLIFEDDARFLTPSLSIPEPPKGWDMLYLGGNVQKIFDDEQTNTSTTWKKVACLTTHAYVIRNSMYNKILAKSKEWLKNKKYALDEFYCKEMHPECNNYILTPEYVLQFNGYSDVRKSRITYNQTSTQNVNIEGEVEGETTIDKLDAAEHAIENDEAGNAFVRLKLPNIPEEDLPTVAIITPTRNCRDMFYFSIANFYKFNYPKHKLQWIIADDGDEDQRVRDLIPEDDRIKYINCKVGMGNYLSVTKKLNLCISYTGPDVQYIVHMFDNVYYPPNAILARIKTLLAYNEKGKECVGCNEFGLYDIMLDKSFTTFYPDANDNKTILHNGSLAYKKSFWETMRFDEHKYSLESFHFTRNRFEKIITLPFNFVMYALDMNGKINKLKYNKDPKKNYIDEWDPAVQKFIRLIKDSQEILL